MIYIRRALGWGELLEITSYLAEAWHAAMKLAISETSKSVYTI